MTYKSISYAIFTGSNFIGCMNSKRFSQEKILENSDQCFEGNSIHLQQNYKDKLQIITPSEWQKSGYLENLATNKYDYFYANPNCSGLSSINRNANANHYRNASLFDTFNIIEKLKPKVFFIENAPTLSNKTGWPILEKMAEQLGSEYTFNVTKDYGKFHNTPMNRHRTLVTGYRRDLFNNKSFALPHEVILTKNLLEQVAQKPEPHDIGLFEHSDFDKALCSIIENNYDIFKHMIRTYKKKYTVLSIILSTHPRNPHRTYEEVYNWDKIIAETPLTNKFRDTLTRDIDRKINKLIKGGGVWDKSPTIIHKDIKLGISLTAMAVMYNFEEARLFNIREYANMMGYPKDFKFEDNISVGHIAQGVPANFAEYVHRHMANVLDNNVEGIETDAIVQLNNATEARFKAITLDTFKALSDVKYAFIK